MINWVRGSPEFACMPTSSSTISTRCHGACSMTNVVCSMANFVCRSLPVRIWPRPEEWGILEGGTRAVMLAYGFALGGYFGCMARFACIVTKFVCIMANLVCMQHDKASLSTHMAHMTNLSAYDKLSLRNDTVCLQQANFAVDMEYFAGSTQINSACHADDKVRHEVAIANFFRPPAKLALIWQACRCILELYLASSQPRRGLGAQA